MRLRLLVDAEVDDAAIPSIADLVAFQPVVEIRMFITGNDLYGLPKSLAGRFVGAQQLHEAGA